MLYWFGHCGRVHYDRTTTSWCGQYWFRRISIYLSFFLYAFFSSRFSQNCRMDIIETRIEHLYRMSQFGKGVLNDSGGCSRSFDLEIKNSLPSINSIFRNESSLARCIHTSNWFISGSPLGRSLLFLALSWKKCCFTYHTHPPLPLSYF